MGSGVVLSVSDTFTDWFGYHPDDLPGTYMTTLVVEEKKLEE